MSDEIHDTDNIVSGWDAEVPSGPPMLVKKPKLESLTTAVGQSKADEVEVLITKCLAALEQAHEGKFDSDKAQNVAAMFLSAQMKLSYFIADVELRARQSKNDIQRVEAEKYHAIKISVTGKLTEEALKNSIAKDLDVVAAKSEWAEAEAEGKKWNYLLATLREGHIFFRNLGKSQMM